MHRRIQMMLLVFVLSAVDAAMAQAQQCRVEIASPVMGDKVRSEGNVSGTAQIPAGTHLWVFADRRGLALVWPQGGGPVRISDGKWRALVTYGVPRDDGSDFEVRALVLTAGQYTELLNWVDRAERTGQYPGMRLPPFVEGCPLHRLL